MTVKAGQKCTAIRRAMAPAAISRRRREALTERLARTKVGDPRAEDTRMGALVSVSQCEDVRARSPSSKRPARGSSRAIPTPSHRLLGGAFMPPVLLRTDDPWGDDAVHDVEPFGPVSTIMPYRTWTTRSRSPIAAWAASCCRCSPTRPRPRASSSRARRPIMAGCWLSTAPTRPNRPAMARRFRCWSTAVPAAPAAARRWAASAGSSITCSGPRSSRRRR